MSERSRYVASIISAALVAVLAGPVGAATLTTGVAVPFTGSVTPGSAATVSYTGLNVSSMSSGSTPNGSYTSTIFGTVSGTLPIAGSTSTAGVSTAFAYDATTGFRLIGLYTLNLDGGHSNTSSRYANGVGQVIGSSPVNSTQSKDTNGILGSDAWLYSTVGNSNISLGLTNANTGSTNFSYTKNVPANAPTTPNAFSGTYHISTPAFVNDAGTAVGTTNRYGGDTATTPTASLGTSAWIYNGVTTTEIGLLGSNYTFNAATGTGTTGRSSTNAFQGLNANGMAMGYASAYYDRGDGSATSLGQDGWVYNNGGMSGPIGLYQRGIDPDVQGFSTLGFKYFNTPTANVGTTAASSQVRSTSFTSINASGQVLGSSQYYTASSSTAAGGFKGTDGFVYTPTTGVYRQVGLFANTGGFMNGVTPASGSSSFVSNTGARSTTVSFINGTGKSVGTSTQYLYYTNTSGVITAASGTAAWLDDGVSTGGSTRIGLFNQTGDPLPTMHVNSTTGASSSSITNLTNSGLVGGFSARYYTPSGGVGTQFGQDAFIYNSNTGSTVLIDPVDAANTAAYTSSSILYLSEDGFAVGQYSVGTGLTSTGAFNKAFLYSPITGFADLGSTISPSLSAAGYQNLIQAFYTSAGGGTILTSASLTASSTVNALATVTIPEPTSLASAAIFGLGLLRRRRTREQPAL